MGEITHGNQSPFVKKINRCRSFHFRYLGLCRAKNHMPAPEIKSKNNATSVLDFFGDKLKTDDWLFVIESLHYDQILQHLAIRLRKNSGSVLEHIDTEKKAKVFKQRPAVYTKYVFSGIVKAIANCIQFNKNLIVLNLEALPLSEKYVVSIAKALSTSEQIRQISFQRSPIGDNGCEALCSTIKYLASIDTLNLSECNLTVQAARHIGDLIKFQKICRYSDAWQKSLRYQDVNPNTMSGLRVISIARNPNITDEGAAIIIEILKEDAWIKIIDMETCGLTEIGANLVLDCLELNNSIIDFNVRNNVGVSKFLHRSIRQQLGKDEEPPNEGDLTSSSGKKTKISMTEIRERLKFLEEQIVSEKALRKQVELMNEKLHGKIIEYEMQLAEGPSVDIPDGYVLVKNESLQAIIRERNDLYNASVENASKTKGYLKKVSKIRMVKSEMKYKQHGAQSKISKSDYKFGKMVRMRLFHPINNLIPDFPQQHLPSDIVIEKIIGDKPTNYPEQMTARVKKNANIPQHNIDGPPSTIECSESEEILTESDQIKVFIQKKENRNEDKTNCAPQEQCPSPRSIFLGIAPLPSD